MSLALFPLENKQGRRQTYVLQAVRQPQPAAHQRLLRTVCFKTAVEHRLDDELAGPVGDTVAEVVVLFTFYLSGRHLVV